MNKNSSNQLPLRNDKSIWLTVAAILSAFTVAATAATITENASAPTANIVASQLTDLGPGTFDGGRDYADNGGPPGQVFTVASTALINAITVKGRGDSAGSWNNGPQPMTGIEPWAIQISQVNLATGQLTPLDTESAIGFSASTNISDYVTFTLASPVSLTPGNSYAFSIALTGGLGWFGFAYGATDAYANGYAFNNNTSTANPGGNNGGPKGAFSGYAAPSPNNFDLVFAVQEAVPEPTTLTLVGLAGLGLVAAGKRRRA